MVEDFEGYSETEIEVLKQLGLIDADLVDKKVEPVKYDEQAERESLEADCPHITVKKDRGNYLDIDLEEADFFGGMKGYLQFIYGECHNPKNEGMVVRGNFKTISYLNEYDAKCDLFGGHNFEVTNPPKVELPEGRAKEIPQAPRGMLEGVPKQTHNLVVHRTITGKWYTEE